MSNMKKQAIWNGEVIAESNDIVNVEGNYYFPKTSLNLKFLRASSSHTVCPWKGTASYYDIEVDGQVNRGAAWYYPSPKPAAKNIKDHIAFWRGVQVVD